MNSKLEAAIKIAADSIDALRSSDVFRVLEQNEASLREILAGYISTARPDLAGEVTECLADLA